MLNVAAEFMRGNKGYILTILSKIDIVLLIRAFSLLKNENRFDIIEKLETYNINLNWIDSDGKTLIEICNENGDKEFANFLRNY